MNGNTSPDSRDRDRLERLWSAALPLPEAKRREFVAAIDDDALRVELESLLAHAERAEQFFARLDAVVQEVHDEAGEAEAGGGTADGGDGSRRTSWRDVPDPLIGERLGHYHVQARLGEGGMGVVYRALDTRLQRTVALKFLPARLNSDPKVSAHFLNEARAAAALDHPNICNIHEIGAADGLSFIAMAYYPGRTLEQVLEGGALPVPDALGYALQIARGLSAAHDRGIIHRDVKPGNVMITAEGVVKLLDFGIARITDVSDTHPGLSPGTIAYMSPEQLTARAVDQRTDYWSLGVVLYEMCTGVRPFRTADPGAILHSILYEQPANPATNGCHIPAPVHAIIRRLLEKDPADRYEYADELVAELMAVLVPVSSARPGVRTGRWRQRSRRTVYPVAGAIGLAMIAFLLWAQRPAPVRVLVADAAGDSLFGGTVSERLRHGLASPGVTVIGRASLQDALARMGREASVRLTPDIAREIAVREGMRVFVQVTVDRIGSALLIGAALIAAETGDIIEYHQAAAVDAAELPSAIDGVASAMRRTLGRSRADISDTTPLLAVTTDSTSALRRHLQSVQANRSGDFLRGIQLLQEAIAIDSSFADAHQASGFTHEQLGQRAGRAQQAVTRAYELREGLSAHERHLVEADHYWHVEGDLSSAIRSLRSAHAAVEAVQPGRVLNRRSYGLALMLNGDLVEADSVMQEARRFAPCPATTTHLVNVLHALDRDDEAREVLRAAVDQWPTNPFLRMDQAHFVATAGRYRAAHDDVERRLHHGFTLPFALRAEAVFDAVEGRVDESIEHLRRLQEYQLDADLLAGRSRSSSRDIPCQRSMRRSDRTCLSRSFSRMRVTHTARAGSWRIMTHSCQVGSSGPTDGCSTGSVLLCSWRSTARRPRCGNCSRRRAAIASGASGWTTFSSRWISALSWRVSTTAWVSPTPPSPCTSAT
jgi:Tfp pilus assembly protein PilF